MLGSIFKPEIPLGPTRDVLISCHASATGKGKLHGRPECRTLRSAASVNQIDIPFGEAVERLCANCRWPLPADSPILPLGAAVSEVDSLTIWLDRDPDDEEDIEAERDAAIALSTGDYPPHTNDVGDAEEEDDETGHDEEWERYDRARNFRSGRHSHWRRLHSYLARSNEAVAEYPFLAPWAGGPQSRVTAVLDDERRAFAALLQPAHLGLRVGLAAACGVPECRTALMVLIGEADAPPAPECQQLLSLLVSIASRMAVEHLSLQAGVTCMPFKMQTLRLLEAVCDREHDAIRETHEALNGLDAAALDREDEFGWRLLSQVVSASAVSMRLLGD